MLLEQRLQELITERDKTLISLQEQITHIHYLLQLVGKQSQQPKLWWQLGATDTQFGEISDDRRAST